MNCQFEGCKGKWEFSCYRLNDDFTKDWLHLCDFHERHVIKCNAIQRRLNPGKKWVDITGAGVLTSTK